MKKTVLLLSTLGALASIASADIPAPPNSIYSMSQVMGVASAGFYTFGQDFVVEAFDISCTCLSTIWEWDGKRWSPVQDVFIADAQPYVSTYIIGVNGACQVAVLVDLNAYTTSTYTFGGVYDPGIGTKWDVSWPWLGVVEKRRDQWEQYCDGAGPEEISPTTAPGQCGF